MRTILALPPSAPRPNLCTKNKAVPAIFLQTSLSVDGIRGVQCYITGDQSPAYLTLSLCDALQENNQRKV